MANVSEERHVSTQEITQKIKSFFRATYSNTHQVLCGYRDPEGRATSEYIADVLVTTFDPKKVVTPASAGKEASTRLHIPSSPMRVFLAVESELGGVSASSALGVMRNVVEDYLKLMLIRTKYRVMVFTSLPYRNELHHVESRVNQLRELYHQAGCNDSGVLLIHLLGAPRTSSSQVQTSIRRTSIRGFLISGNGDHWQEFDTPSLVEKQRQEAELV
ncbi:MAG: hypothetical protein ACN6OP_20495 [Pseudomonadales bacterium]